VNGLLLLLDAHEAIWKEEGRKEERREDDEDGRGWGLRGMPDVWTWTG
jgi:hypothetical protein